MEKKFDHNKMCNSLFGWWIINFPTFSLSLDYYFNICFVVALVCSKSLACFSNRAQIYHSRPAATQHLRCQNRVHHVQIFPQLQCRPLSFWSYCILFVAQLWQHKALIYSEAVGGARQARARRAITLTSNCRETQPRDGDHKSVSDEPRHSQLICIHSPAGLLSESISTGAETAAGGGMRETLTRRRCSACGIWSDALGVRFASSYCK